MSQEMIVQNLERLKERKRARHDLLMRQARKYGQLRYMKHLHFLVKVEGAIQDIVDLPPFLSREIEKEEKELAVIDEDLREIKGEIRALE